jgi:hypothetical protein
MPRDPRPCAAGEGFSTLLGEAPTGLALALSRPFYGATVTFDKRIARLRWSNRALAAAVRAVAAGDRAELAIADPQVCNDLRAWVAGGYSTIPPTTQSFLAAAGAAEERSGPTRKGLLGKLAKYESPRMKGLAHSIAVLEGATVSALRPGLEPLLAHLAEALGLGLSTGSAPSTSRFGV